MLILLFFLNVNLVLLMSNLMCSLFRHYNIIPIFIYDGKPPAEKYEELKNRRQNRQKFREQYKNLLKNFGNQRTNIQNTMLNTLY